MFGMVSFWFYRLWQQGREAWCTVRAHVSTSIDMSINFHKQIRLNGQTQPNGGTYALFRAPGQIQGFPSLRIFYSSFFSLFNLLPSIFSLFFFNSTNLFISLYFYTFVKEIKLIKRKSKNERKMVDEKNIKAVLKSFYFRQISYLLEIIPNFSSKLCKNWTLSSSTILYFESMFLGTDAKRHHLCQPRVILHIDIISRICIIF